MANEIWHSYDEAFGLYALIWRKTDDKVWDDTAEAWDTYTDLDLDDYIVPMTNHVDSDYHTADFPTAIATGVYRVQIMLVVDPPLPDADADIAVAQGEIYWDGSAEIDLFTLDTSINDDIVGADGDTLKSLSDQLDGLTSSSYKKTNVYGPGE